jgi:mono/diheme cytochrome c family protein
MLGICRTPFPYALLFVGLGGFTASPAGQREPPAATSPVTAPEPRAAASLYRQFCQRCHDTDGSGAGARKLMAIPDFRRPGWQERRTAARLVGSILEGKGSRMPAFGDRLSPAEANDLADYVRAFAPSRTSNQAASAETRATVGTSFAKRFRELRAEWEDLNRQFRESLSPTPRR